MAVRRNHRGKWIVDIRFTHPDGKVQRVEKTSPVQARRGAEAYERKVRNKLLDGSYQREEALKEIPTLQEFSKEFLETYVVANNKPSEKITKEWIFRKHLIPTLGSRRLDEIRLRDVERLKADKVKTLANKTVNNVLTVLGKTLRYAADLEIIETVPMIRFLKVAQPKIDFLGFEELDRLVEEARDEPIALTSILCAADAGLRAGEIRALQWDDLDFVAAQLTVQRTDYRGYVGTPKGGRLRIVEMTSRLTAALKSIRHLKGPWVFSDAQGNIWSRGELDARLFRSCRKAKLRKMGWHSLRHTFCSHLAMKGAPARAIQELAGHASLTTTQRYMHLSPGSKRDAISLLEKDFQREHRANMTQRSCNMME